MPLDEFWHGDIRLLECYQKAYERDKSYTAWLNGLYVFEASTKAIANGNRTKRSDPVEKYNDWVDPMKRFEKMTKLEAEGNFRRQQIEQNNWFFRK